MTTGSNGPAEPEITIARRFAEAEAAGRSPVYAELADQVSQDDQALAFCGTSACKMAAQPPARCATLLPVLASLPQPLALVEVGSSAGLCLFPDRYAHDYAGYRIEAA